jgi:hypothetical protein
MWVAGVDSSVKAAGAFIIEEQTACFARMEMPWENLQAAADRGVLFTGLKKHDSSLGYVSAIVKVPTALCKELCADGETSLMNLHCRYGEELNGIPADLSRRSDEQLASDEIFCEWQIAAREDIKEQNQSSPRNQDASRWSFRVFQHDPETLAYFIEQLARVRAEIANRVKFNGDASGLIEKNFCTSVLLADHRSPILF